MDLRSIIYLVVLGTEPRTLFFLGVSWDLETILMQPWVEEGGASLGWIQVSDPDTQGFPQLNLGSPQVKASVQTVVQSLDQQDGLAGTNGCRRSPVT